MHFAFVWAEDLGFNLELRLQLGVKSAVVTPGVKADESSVRRTPEEEEEEELVKAIDTLLNKKKDRQDHPRREHLQQRRVDQEMASHGWRYTSRRSWVKNFANARMMQMPDAGTLRRRITRSRAGELIEDLQVGESPTRLDRRAHRALRVPRDIEVEVYVDAVEDDDEDDPSERLLEGNIVTEFRGLVARINFLAQDRGDLQYASKECSRKMSAPRQKDWEAVKRIARYLVGCPRVVTRYQWQDMPNHIACYSDSNWAGCKDTRKSTSGGCFLHGRHLLKTYSRTQSTIALSSAEAELYATVHAASEGLGLAAMAKDYGQSVRPWLYVDASAAIGIAQRKGLGKVRHLDCQSLWVQDAVRQKKVFLEKVPGSENPADMFTKHLDTKTLRTHMLNAGMQAREGRAESAPRLVTDEDAKKEQCKGHDESKEDESRMGEQEVDEQVITVDSLIVPREPCAPAS